MSIDNIDDNFLSTNLHKISLCLQNEEEVQGWRTNQVVFNYKYSNPSYSESKMTQILRIHIKLNKYIVNFVNTVLIPIVSRCWRCGHKIPISTIRKSANRKQRKNRIWCCLTSGRTLVAQNFWIIWFTQFNINATQQTHHCSKTSLKLE